MYKQLDSHIIAKLCTIIGEKNVIVDNEKVEDYSHDEYSGKEAWKKPEAVVKPNNTNEVSRIADLCSKERIPLTPRGGGTGLCGGCVPVYGGIVLCFENMARVIEVDPDNQTATVEPGVRLADFYGAVEDKGLFFPPHPGDETATIGGVIATNAGGARAVRYGVIRNFVRGIEVVLPDGKAIMLGGKYIKNSSGYSLMNLLIGSEGTLGIITKAIIGLLAPPGSMHTLVVPYENLTDAINTVPAIIRSKILPMAVEFIGYESIRACEYLLNKKWPCTGQAHLMIILDEWTNEETMKRAEEIGEICLANNAIDVFVADDRQKQQDILNIRSHVYDSMKNYMVEILDVTVPRASIADFVNDVAKLAIENDIWLPTYGHAADGNVHTHLMKCQFTNGTWQEIRNWEEKIPIARDSIHELGRKYRGTVSGEHGIGLVKKKYLGSFVDEHQMELMKQIKKVFDPRNILNPGKIFDAE